MIIKTCKECKKEGEITGKGLCRKCYMDLYYSKQENKEKRIQIRKKWDKQNPERRRAITKHWHDENSKRHKNTIIIWEKNNPKKKKLYGEKFRKNNPNYMNEWVKNKYKTDINFKIKFILSRALNGSIKNNYNSSKILKILGCSSQQFKGHIESLWLPNMNWDNWTIDGWHIDHVIPKAFFKNISTNLKEQKECFNYKNLRPLWCTTEVAIKNGCNVIGNQNRPKKFIITQ